MRKKKEIIFVFAMFVLNNAFAQTDVAIKRNLPSIGLGVGIISFYGDINDNKSLSSTSGGFLGYHLSVLQKFGSIGVSLNALKGKVSSNERSDSTRNFNFESPIMDVGVNVSFHFDNDFILPKKSIVAPYISAGFGYLTFKPMGDLKDKNGNYYYYWSNGDIRDKSELAADAPLAKKINRDYVFETALPALGDTMPEKRNNDNIKYAYSSFTIPVSVGVNFKLSPSVNINLGTTYYITQTDWIDNISSEGNGARKGNSAKDKFLYSFIAFQYNIGKSKSVANSDKSDFSSIDNTDSDKDGVKDVLDNCADTPPDTKVDSKGCPLDSDNDGVFDYLDKEPDTKRGEIVDANGVTLKDDDLVVEHEAAARVYPGDGAVNSNAGASVSNTSSLPEIYQEVDLNKDGKVSSDEINSAIDNFFEGNTKLTINGIYGLIDYFFEQ